MQVCITFFQFSSLSWSKWVQKNRKKIAKKSWKIAKNHEFLRKKKKEILYLFFPLQLSKLIKMSTKKVLKKLQKNREKSMNFHWNYMKIFIKNVWLFIKIFREFSWFPSWRQDAPRAHRTLDIAPLSSWNLWQIYGKSMVNLWHPDLAPFTFKEGRWRWRGPRAGARRTL